MPHNILSRCAALLALPALLLASSGCRMTNPYASWPGTGVETRRYSPELGPPTEAPPPQESPAAPSQPGSTVPQEFSTDRPMFPETPEPLQPEEPRAKSVPLIQGPIDLGPSTPVPPGVSEASAPARSQPLPLTGPGMTLNKPSLQGPEILPNPRTPASSPEFSVEVPESVLTGEPFTVQISVLNPGRDSWHNLELRTTLPEGVRFADSLTPAETIPLDRLDAGRKQSFSFQLVPTIPEQICLEFTLESAGTELAWKKICTRAQAPRLLTKLVGPERKPLDSRAEYTLSLENVSEQPLGGLRVHVDYDRALLPREASAGADQKPGRLIWQFPVLQPGEALFLQVEFDCTVETGNACVTAEFLADDLPAVQRQSCLSVRRRSATLDLVLSDENDLARVGQEVTAVVRAANHGLQPARNVRLELDIPPSLELADYTIHRGDELLPLPASTMDDVLRFDPVNELPSDGVIEYRVSFRTTQVGEYAFRARLTDEAHPTPLEAGEPVWITP